MAIAVFFRFYQLSEIPPGLYPDVAINGNDALGALETKEFKVFYPENNGREGLFINLIALSFYIFGISVWAIKLVPAIIGVLTTLGIYLMTKELFGHEIRKHANIRNDENQNKKSFSHIRKSFAFCSDIVALLSAFFLSVSFWHVNFSRLGFRAIMVPFILVWGFYFLFKAIRMMQIKHMEDTDKFAKKIHFILYTSYFILSGLIFGLGFHTYISFRVAPLILGVVFLIEIWNFCQIRKMSRDNTQLSVISYQSLIFSWLLFFLAIVIAASPMIIYFYNNPQDFMGRTGQVSVLSSAQPLKELAISAAKSLGMFNFWGDCNWRHNFACKPALPAPVGILFLIGFLWAIYQICNSAQNRAPWRKSLPVAQDEKHIHCFWPPAQISLFLLTWFFTMLLPAALTNEGLPHSLRAIGAIPPVYIFAGIGGWWIINQLKTQSALAARLVGKRKTIFYIVGVVFCLWLIFYSYDLYFIQWGKNPIVKGAFTQNYVDIGNYLNNLPPETKKYVVVNEGGVPVPYPNGIPVSAQTIIFIEKTVGKGNKTFYLKPEELKLIQGVNTNLNYPIVFVLMKYDKAILDFLKEKIPQGEIKEISGIWTFHIKK
jgi:hypothetical protein